MKQPKVLVIVGPTASGKSALGVELAKRFNGEVISADSRQVYRELNIGTGKITKKEMRGVPHYLLDVAAPSRAYSAGAYVKAGRRAIADIAKRGKLPIVVGGTGFYVDALVGRIVLPDVRPDIALRRRYKNANAAKLFELLQKKDPERAKLMDTPSERNNKPRLVRALEIAEALGKTPPPQRELPYDVLWIGIAPDDARLRTKIVTRLRERIAKGMIREAKKLHVTGLSYRRMEALGLEYRSLARHLKGSLSKREMETELQSDIWRYARKQIGYWKRNEGIRWHVPTQKKQIEATVKTWLR